MVQYEQYEQEVKDLQSLIEEAHRVIQDRPIPTNNIQELQAQILHHEVKSPHLLIYLLIYLISNCIMIGYAFMKELAQKIKGYQEQIASLNSKCKMLAVKAKHATMLLTVSDIEGQPEMDEETSQKYSAQATTVRKDILDFVDFHCA